MSNYDLEEIKLLKWQFLLSSFFIISTLISLTLTYNEILKRKKQSPLYSPKEQVNVLRFNRVLASLIATCFIVINVIDKNVRKKYNDCDETVADLQICASMITFIATLIVLYIAFSNSSDDIENPEL
ncbi:MAG: hypothetical protein IKE75_02650 [Bacilli bacterium]|nr:hypothetical protein [Bacilli bacterium]